MPLSFEQVGGVGTAPPLTLSPLGLAGPALLAFQVVPSRRTSPEPGEEFANEQC